MGAVTRCRDGTDGSNDDSLRAIDGSHAKVGAEVDCEWIAVQHDPDLDSQWVLADDCRVERRAVRNGERMLATVQDGYRSQAVAAAIETAIEAGEPVRVEYRPERRPCRRSPFWPNSA